MPPLRSGRASKACDSCRKNKTRCYASNSDRGTCLRCNTLSQPCSLELDRGSASPIVSQPRSATAANHSEPGQQSSVDSRLERLERSVEALVDRLDSRLNALAGISHRPTSPPRDGESTFSSERNPAPVFLIRDAATDAGVQSLEQVETDQVFQADVISKGLVALPTAHSLLKLFHVHYRRWVKFSEDISTESLLLQVRRSPLLLCSVFLIAVRHTTQELADKLAPRLFQEAKRLVTSSLLVVPQSIEFFQAAIILSLWSTTIGQVPLSIDSWMLTGYALQQALASPDFAEVLRFSSTVPVRNAQLDAWCLWNHLCLAHLHSCVGTRRQAIVTQSQIERHLRVVESDNITNFEARMVAEVKLYWTIYQQCCGYQLDLSETKRALQTWHQEWTALFDQPRSQFLQMGFYFAHLLAYCQSVKSPQTVMSISVLSEMLRLSKLIINLAIDTTDERTRHLTDHIYHVVTFSALTLCRLVHTYESNLRAVNLDISALDNLVVTLINWLRSIGLPCHAAHILGGIVSVQFKKLRPDFRPAAAPTAYDVIDNDRDVPFLDDELPNSIAFLYPNFIGSELFTIDDTPTWPQWG